MITNLYFQKLCSIIRTVVFLYFVFLSFSCMGQQRRDTILKVYFNTGKHVLPIREIRKFENAFKGLNSPVIYKIVGYADSIGSDMSNLILSKMRAEYVLNVFINKFNISSNVQVDYCGEKLPISRINNELNRRVDVFLTTKIERIQSDSSEFKTLKIIILDKIQFRPDQPIIEPSSMPYLDSAAGILLRYGREKFEIQGHVNWNSLSLSDSNSGYKRKMDQLSVDRAKAVYDILISRGISQERMTYKGMGNSQMVFPNAKTDDEKRSNMRVEIIIIDKIN